MSEGVLTERERPMEPPRRSWRARYRAAQIQLTVVQKPSRGVAPYSLYVNRPVGRRLAGVAHAIGLRPNQITAASGTVTFGALLLLALVHPSAEASVAVVVLLLVAYGLDAADGQLARMTGGGTAVGELLDHLFDAAKAAAFHVAILLSAVRFDAGLGQGPVFAAAAFTVVATASFLGLVLIERVRDRSIAPPPHRPATWWYRLAVAPTDYGALCLWLLVRPHATAFFWGYGALAVANALHLVVATRSRLREAAALDRTRATARAGGIA